MLTTHQDLNATLTPMVPRRSLLAARCAAAQTAGPKAGCRTNAGRVQPGNFGDFPNTLDRVRHYGYEGFETGFRNIENRLDQARETRAEFEKRELVFQGCHIFLTQYDRAASIAPAGLIARVTKQRLPWAASGRL